MVAGVALGWAVPEGGDAGDRFSVGRVSVPLFVDLLAMMCPVFLKVHYEQVRAGRRRWQGAPFDVLLLGPPGAGKGTQGARLAATLGVPRVSTGELLRDAAARRTALGRRAQATMAAGQLVDDAVVLALVRARLEAPDAALGVVLDGVVRTVAQAEGLAALLAARGRRLACVLVLEASEAEIRRRVETRRALEHREDDSPEVVTTRLRRYREEIAAIVRWYAGHDVTVHRIRGDGTVEEVAERVRAVVVGRDRQRAR